MSFYIYRDPRFEEALESLKTEGGKGLFAVKKVEEIVNKLLIHKSYLHHAGRLTKRGEHRIRYCRKYDLCGGYRLITIQNENYLILAYIGNHDDCDRWLENNKGLRYDILEMESEIIEEKDLLSTSTVSEALLLKDYLEEKAFVQKYEKTLEDKINNSSIQRVISSWFKSEK
jgi:hypothetical protein